MHHTLAAITAAVDSNMNDRWVARGTVPGDASHATTPVTFNSCLLYFSPRFVVPDSSNDPQYLGFNGVANAGQYTALANSIENIHDVHFLVDIRSAGATSWDDAHKYTSQKGTGNLRHLILPVNFVAPGGVGGAGSSTLPANFINFFGDMVGINAGQLNNAASYAPLAQLVIPGGTVLHV